VGFDNFFLTPACRVASFGLRMSHLKQGKSDLSKYRKKNEKYSDFTLKLDVDLFICTTAVDSCTFQHPIFFSLVV
jgi:hypothetical protein